ncbi:hypothetical protein ACFPL7_24140 [Dongia soli]|uniref:Uncharacterized protein n=1 Tax=Dongia soli TaxID=600628 RepID=A0ABU5EJ02_9PROT|nr:hypothetical protein [Dongia soli]MDY0885395.1 hypothetical protein [Dongia soli]
MEWGKDHLEKIREGQAQAAEKRKRLLDKVKNAPPPRVAKKFSEPTHVGEHVRRCSSLVVDRAINALKQFQFLQLHQNLNLKSDRFLHVNRPTEFLVRSFLEGVATGVSRSILQWPAGQRDISIVHSIAAIAALGSVPTKQENGIAWCDAVPDFRTLFFPWRSGSSGTTGHAFLINRDHLVALNKKHLTRQSVDAPEASPELKKLHVTIGHLQQLSKQDPRRPHLAHPTLGELLPAYSDVAPKGMAFPSPICDIFYRVCFGAGIEKLHDYRSAICNPHSAPFGIFGISASSDLRKVLAHQVFQPAKNGRPPDICILDLAPSVLGRMGNSWREKIDSFLDQMFERFSAMPVLAVTQDPFVHSVMARRLDGNRGKRPNKERASPSSVLVRLSSDILTPDPEITILSRVSAKFHSFGGAGFDAISAMSEAARMVSDGSAANAILRDIRRMRQALSLPCGVEAAHACLSAAESDEAADFFLEPRSLGTILRPILDAISAGAAGEELKCLRRAEVSIRSAFKQFQIQTPVGSVLSDWIDKLVRKSSHSAIAFPSEDDRKLAQCYFSQHPVLGSAVTAALSKGRLHFISTSELDAYLHQAAKTERRTLRRLILISPSLDTVSTTLLRPWIPGDLVIVSDHAFTRRLTNFYGALRRSSALPAGDQVASRLSAIIDAAEAEIAARSVPTIELEFERTAAVDVHPGLVDLTTDDDDDSGETVEFALASGRRLRVRAGAAIVRYAAAEDVNPFSKAIATEIAVGETILVPDPDFVEQAKGVLPLAVLAQGAVTNYHILIEAALPSIRGATMSEKVTTVIKLMKGFGGHERSDAAVRDWLNVAKHKKMPPETWRSHAPMLWEDFSAFMQALNLGMFAQQIWGEGIAPFRRDRRRAGFRMARAFLSVLVDPHGASAAASKDFTNGIATLRENALEHLDIVVDREHFSKE